VDFKGVKKLSRIFGITVVAGLAVVGAATIGAGGWLASVKKENASENKKTYYPYRSLKNLQEFSSNEQDQLIEAWAKAQSYADSEDFDPLYRKIWDSLSAVDVVRMKTIVVVGGGARLGYLSATTMHEMEEKLQGGNIARFSDYMVGTSAGALNLLAHSINNKTGLPLCDFEQQCALYRDAEFLQGEGGFSGLSTPLLSSEALKNTINRIAPKDLWLSELENNVGLLVINGETQQAEILSSWEARKNPERDFKVRDAALATSSTIMAYPAAEILSRSGKAYRFHDAGFGGFNNPIIAAISAARLNDAAHGLTNAQYVVICLDNGTIDRDLPQAHQGFLGYAMPGVSNGMPLAGVAINSSRDLTIQSAKADPNVHVVYFNPLLKADNGQDIDYDMFSAGRAEWNVLEYLAAAANHKNKYTIGQIADVMQLIRH
jgi:hypothetical protein